jgi:cation transport ATPase
MLYRNYFNYYISLNCFVLLYSRIFFLTLLQGWSTFFEEPIMLIAFVLLGKNLELRAKLKAASDLTGLLNILPTRARLMVDSSSENSSYIEVSCNSLSVGDVVVVLPGVSGFIIWDVYFPFFLA